MNMNETKVRTPLPAAVAYIIRAIGMKKGDPKDIIRAGQSIRVYNT